MYFSDVLISYSFSAKHQNTIHTMMVNLAVSNVSSSLFFMHTILEYYLILIHNLLYVKIS